MIRIILLEFVESQLSWHIVCLGKIYVLSTLALKCYRKQTISRGGGTEPQTRLLLKNDVFHI